MKKTIVMLLAVLVLGTVLSSCDQLMEWQGNAIIKGLAKYFDKGANQNGGIRITLLSATIIIKPNQVPLDVAPLLKVTSSNGDFSFNGIAPGSYIVVAEDPSGEYQPANTYVTVAANGEVITEDLVLTKAIQHVVIFRGTGIIDEDGEWGETTAIGDFLTEEVGMTEGLGANQFEYKSSADMGGYTPNLGDLIIIGGDQTTSFYDTYTINKDTFDTFVDDGGTMFWIACDGGWGAGNFTSTLPGGVTWRDSYENYNDIVYFEHPITRNFPEQLYGNYASHGGFDNLDSLTLINLMVYVKEASGLLPTYIEYRTGNGKVLASTIPFEFYVANGPDSMPDGFSTSYRDLFKLMLGRSIKYIMGLPVSEDVPPSDVAMGLKALPAQRMSH